jgi:SNF2 family DNA or RNA helicase
MTFKQKLHRLVEKYDVVKDRKKIDDYKRMIRYGVMGELGENYFLFLYRDLYRSAAYYGSIVFLNKPDDMGNPVRIHCFEQDGVEQTRNIYIRTALYFLKNEESNTMELAGNMVEVFNRAREKVNEYIETETSPLPKLRDFNFDVSDQEIRFQEIALETGARQIENRNLKRRLQILKEKPETGNLAVEKPEVRLGLNLKIENAGIEEGNIMVFQPMVVPVKQTGQFGNPKRLAPADVPRYNFTGLSPFLENFLNHFAALNHHLFSDVLKTRIINQLYADVLMEEVFALPTDLRFCQTGVFKGWHPLHTVIFDRVDVWFAPSLKKETVFTIRLTFTADLDDGNGERKKVELDTADDYTIQGVHVLFVSPEGEHCLAVPEKSIQSHFINFFKFLETDREFFICDFDEILNSLREIQSDYIHVDTQLLKKYALELKPAPILNILPMDPERGKSERVEIDFDYRGEIKKFLEKHPDKAVFIYDRDETFENMCRHLLKSDPMLKEEIDYDQKEKSVFYYFYFKKGDYLGWVMDRAQFYLEKGFRIYMAKWKRYIGAAGSRITISIDHNIDWLEFKPTAQDFITGKSFDIEAVDLENNTVTDSKGNLHILTKEELKKLIAISRYGERVGNMFRVPSKNHILIGELYDKRMDDIPELREILSRDKRLKKFKGIEDYALSPGFNGELRNYQKEGFKWLRFLKEYDFSGCLADDMGLGKTVQTLAMLQTLKDIGGMKTSLLVAPVSAIPNWEAETRKFAPGIVFHRHMGAAREKSTAGWNDVDLIFTSYATMRNDIDLFSEFEFDYIILDESQNIKNYTSQVSKAAKVLKGNHRLALSGTPIENNTMELWSLFDFLMPGYLGTSRWFTQNFAVDIEREKSERKTELLKKMIYPFILRRKKEEVETELPEKTEIVTRLAMDEEQSRLYEEMATYYREEIEREINEKGVEKSSIKIFEGMLRLRQLCLFPRLVNDKFREVPSAKFDHFVELMEDILSEDHKVLIFSQFVEALHILRDYFDDSGIGYSYIDGSVHLNTREKMVKSFQEEADRRVFLLSLKAGGVALNLTAADYVIIFDPWWNPAVEAQAIDRSHRIGQTRKVLVYRMVMENSIEEKMLELQEAKTALVENLITSDAGTFKNLKKEDILSLFR